MRRRKFKKPACQRERCALMPLSCIVEREGEREREKEGEGEGEGEGGREGDREMLLSSNTWSDSERKQGGRRGSGHSVSTINPRV